MAKPTCGDRLFYVTLEPIQERRGCVLEREDESIVVEFPASTEELAIHAAETGHPHYRAVAVHRVILGRCARCRGVLFDGDQLREMKGGGVLCEACP